MKEKRLVASVLIGNTMEFYDFIVFAFMSKYISNLFFPNNDSLVSYIATFGVFASGYLMRPIGGLFFGYIGDRYGRKKSLSYSVLAITIATFLIGCLPTHQEVGIIAPVLLTICRLLQGFSVSGEEGGAAVYLAEMVGEKQVAYAGSLVLGSAYFGVLLGSATCLALSFAFSDAEVIAFAWRVPFFLSVLLGIPSLIMRRNLIESSAFEQKNSATNPVTELFKTAPLSVVLDTIMVASLAIPIYIFTIFIPSYLSLSLQMQPMVAQSISVISLIFLSFGVPVLGKAADAYGIKKVYFIGCALNVVLGYPIFWLISSGKYEFVFVGMLLLGIALLFIAGPMFALLIEKYKSNVRYTAVSFVFNTSMSIFGSLTPMVAFYLISYFNNLTSPWLLIFVSGLIGLACLALNKKTTNQLNRRMPHAHDKNTPITDIA